MYLVETEKEELQYILYPDTVQKWYQIARYRLQTRTQIRGGNLGGVHVAKYSQDSSKWAHGTVPIPCLSSGF